MRRSSASSTFLSLPDRAASIEEAGQPFYEDQFCQDPLNREDTPDLCKNLDQAREVRARYTLERGNVNVRRPAVGVTYLDFENWWKARLNTIAREFVQVTLEASQQAWDEGAQLRVAANWLYDNRYDAPDTRSPNSIGYHALNMRASYSVFDGWDYLLFKNGLLYQTVQLDEPIKNANLWFDTVANSVTLVGNAWPLYARIRLGIAESPVQPLLRADTVANPTWP
jgi:hypothetical protein